jgi:hypothetical protein
MASEADSPKKKARKNGLLLVAGTGFEAVSRRLRKVANGQKRS